MDPSPPSLCSNCGALATDQLIEKGFEKAAPGTRHHTLLTTNEPPEGSELPVVFIHSAISKTDGRLARLNQEIPKLQERLRRLEDERASLTSYRARNKAVLSPLRRIPPELLGEIFSWTLPFIGNALSVDTFNILRSPWVLTHISRRWRAVCLSIPSLW
ncbi:hypothetical protein K438DRAFT_1710460, partial [Mycena galopus ATCC 62051]